MIHAITIFGKTSFPNPEELAEHLRRAKIFNKAEQGDEEALAELRDGYGLRTLMLRGKRLIDDGVLVGSKP